MLHLGWLSPTHKITCRVYSLYTIGKILFLLPIYNSVGRLIHLTCVHMMYAWYFISCRDLLEMDSLFCKKPLLTETTHFMFYLKLVLLDRSPCLVLYFHYKLALSVICLLMSLNKVIFAFAFSIAKLKFYICLGHNHAALFSQYNALVEKGNKSKQFLHRKLTV